MRPTTSRPTARQLAYLKALAARTATSFAYPGNRSEASREIERLRQLPSLAVDRDSVDGRDLDSDLERCAYATAPAPGEIAGYGSSASWSRHGASR